VSTASIIAHLHGPGMFPHEELRGAISYPNITYTPPYFSPPVLGGA
jgi:hypothetical protein